MATVTYVGDEPREVSMLPAGAARIVQPDEKFTVPDSVAMSYACQPHYFEVEGYEWPPPDEGDDDTGPSVEEMVEDLPPVDGTGRNSTEEPATPTRSARTAKGK